MTWLYVPGDRPDRFVKALASGADAIILDLEDAVAPARKDYARHAIAEFLTSTHDIPVSVRISDIDRDVEFTAGATVLRLPKVESAEQVRRVAGLTPAGLHPLVESALAGAQDGGTVVLPDGRFADRAMIVAARRTLELATRYSMR